MPQTKIGIVLVACLAAKAATFPMAKMRSGCALASCIAVSCILSGWPPVCWQSTVKVLPSVQPSLVNPLMK
jgi:hypothetical protein